jgi:hypothetical protein
MKRLKESTPLLFVKELMMRKSVITSAFALCVFMLPAYAAEAMIYAVHGIPGTALGVPTTDLPVDVSVNGVCVPALNGFNFGQIRGPLALPAPANYTVEIKPADALQPCSRTTLLSTVAAVTPGINASIVAHLTAVGVPNLAVFVNDTSPTGPGEGRFLLHHAAQAPAVDARVFRGVGAGASPAVSVPGFANGAQVGAQFRPGQWLATLSAGGSVVFGPAELKSQPNTVQLVYAIGTFPDSFTVITKTIPTAR